MLHVVLAVVGVLAAVAGAYLVLVVSDVRRGRGEPPGRRRTAPARGARAA